MRPESISAGRIGFLTRAEGLGRSVPPYGEDMFHLVKIEKHREVDWTAELHHGTVKDTGCVPLLPDGSEWVKDLQQRLEKAVDDADEGLLGAAPSAVVSAHLLYSR